MCTLWCLKFTVVPSQNETTYYYEVICSAMFAFEDRKMEFHNILMALQTGDTT